MKKRILIIDDDHDILEPISLILEAEGYVICTTEKGDEAYKNIDTFKPDLILLDILLSGNDGRTICKILKSQESTKHIPIVLMSAHPSAKLDALQSEANDFIAKPFETSELVEIVKKNISSLSK